MTMKNFEREKKEPLNDRAATEDEIAEANRLGLPDKMASLSEVADAEEREYKWLEFMQTRDFKKLVSNGAVRLNTKKDGRGEIAEIEVRDRDGTVLFFSTKKGLDAALRLFETGKDYGEN